MSNIKNCPCCNGLSLVDREDVFCTECGLNLKIYDFIYRGEAKNYEEARQMAIETWNTRKPMQEIVENLEIKKEIMTEDKMLSDGYIMGFCHAMDESIEIVKEVDGMNE